MKNVILILTLALSFSHAFAQSHFSTRLALRLENGHVFADLVANQEYDLQSLQFGFYHDAANSNFIGVSSQILPGNYLFANEKCPKNVLCLWYNPDGVSTHIPKDAVILTIEYEELIPSDHFICMMPSKTTFDCKFFYREVIGKNSESLIVDDVCVNYKIENGNIKLDAIDHQAPSIQISYKEENKTIQISWPGFNYSNNVNLDIIDQQGRLLRSEQIFSTTSQFSVADLASGQYYCLLQSNGKIVKSSMFNKI